MYPGNLTLAAALIADERRRQAERNAKRAALLPRHSEPRRSAMHRLLARLAARRPASTTAPASLGAFDR